MITLNFAASFLGGFTVAESPGFNKFTACYCFLSFLLLCIEIVNIRYLIFVYLLNSRFSRMIFVDFCLDAMPSRFVFFVFVIT